MKNEFALAFNEVLEDKQLPKEVVMEALEAAMISAYRRAVNASNAQRVEAEIDPETGKVTIFAEKEVVESVQDPRTEVSVKEALKVDENAEPGGMVVVESTPRNFGRVAAQTARQVIQQRIREAEREVQYNHFSKQLGEILSGIVQAVNAQQVTLGLDMKAEGIMPRNQQIPGERFRVHDRVRALLLEVKDSPRGPQIILSRAHRNFLRRLLENEVPEIYHGLVEVRSIAREPGKRSKVAVSALQSGVDPVGACVGIRGVRIQAIVRELNDEKIDVIEWNQDPAAFIAKALSPARVSGVYLNEHAKGAKTATVVVPEDQLSLAIGRDGQNARLAAKLTSWRIDIKSLPEAASDAIYKLDNDPMFAEISKEEVETRPQVELILAKKAEGRPVTPEEYQVLTQFVDRVETSAIRKRKAEKQAEQERKRIAMADVPEQAFEVPLRDFEVSDRVYAVISEAGFETIGDLMVQMKTDSDKILALNGMGPKGMQELEEALGQLTFEEEVEEVAEAVEGAEQAPESVTTEEPKGELETGEESEEEPEIEAEEAIEEAAEAVVEAEQAVEEAAEAVVEAVEVQETVEGEIPAPEAEAAQVVEAEAQVEPQELEQEAEEGAEEEPALAEPESEAVTAEEEIEEEPEEETQSLDEIFSLRSEELKEFEYDEEDEEEEFGDKKKRKKKKKKKKYVQVEYDPEKDMMVVKRKRKRGQDDWDERDWGF
jgi:N utilization substance protein A